VIWRAAGTITFQRPTPPTCAATSPCQLQPTGRQGSSSTLRCSRWSQLKAKNLATSVTFNRQFPRRFFQDPSWCQPSVIDDVSREELRHALKGPDFSPAASGKFDATVFQQNADVHAAWGRVDQEHDGRSKHRFRRTRARRIGHADHYEVRARGNQSVFAAPDARSRNVSPL